MRRSLPAIAALACVACGAAHGHSSGQTPRARVTAASAAAPSASAAPAPTAMDALAALAEKDAPGTRELLRRDVTSTERARVELGGEGRAKDACFRIFILADFPAKATLETKGRELTSGEAVSATPLVLGPRGPVCVRRGDASVLRIEGTGTAHVIVRVSP